MNLEKQVKKLYLDGVTIRKIKKQLNLTESQYHKIYCKLRDAGEITPREFKRQKKQPRTVKNFSYNRSNNTFHINKGDTYYCNAKTVNQAERIVELLKECNWDKSKANTIKKQVIIEEGIV